MGHIECIAVEADWHVERKASSDGDARTRRGVKGDEASGRIDRPARHLFNAAESDADTARHRLGDNARPGLRTGGVALEQLERGRRTIACPDPLIAQRWRARGQAGLVIAPVLEPEAMKATVARFEEGDNRCQIVGTANAIGDIVAPSRIGPTGIAFLVARGQLDNLGAPFRPAACAPAARSGIIRSPVPITSDQ